MIVISLLSLCFAAKGEEKPLELDSFEHLWEMTVKRNPTLATYKLNVEIAGYNHRAAMSYLFPTVSAIASAQDNFTIPTTIINSSQPGQANEIVKVRFGTKYTYTGALTAQYTLLNWQKVVAGRQAENYVELQRATEEYYMQTLKNQASSLYFQTLVSLRALEINKQDLAFADTLVKIALKKYDEGALALIDLNQAQINYNQVEQNAIVSENLYENNIHQLRKLLGLPAYAPIVFTEKLPVTAYDGLYSLGEDKLLETYVHMVKDAVFNLKSQKAANTPTLSFNAYYGAEQFRSTFSFSFKSSYWHGQQYIGLSLTQPLFAGFGNRNRIRSAKKSVELAEKQLSIAIEQSAVNDHLLLGEVKRKHDIAGKALDSFNLYEKNLRMYKIKYDEGAIDLNTFLLYFRDYLVAENAYLSQLSDYYTYLSIIISRN